LARCCWQSKWQWKSDERSHRCDYRSMIKP
jgi:hypothetical protein